jgi:hypothetical protein
MRDFGSWFADQGKAEPEEVDDTLWLRCRGCGKEERLSLAEYENGDTGWYADDDGSGEGVCGGSQFCLP